MEMAHNLLALGNPLLDIIVKCESDSPLISKYQLPPDGAIEPEPWQMPLFDEIFKYQYQQKPGGSAQNTCRIARSLLNTNTQLVFIGCVGNDKYAKILTQLVTESGVTTMYMHDDKEPTGISADIVHGPNRSLCAYIGAAKWFNMSHLLQSEVTTAMSSSSIFYIEGFFLTHSFDSASYVADYATRNKKTFALNLSAVYVCRMFSHHLIHLLPFTHLLIGNESEVTEFCTQLAITTENCMEMVSKLCKYDFKGAPSTFNVFKNGRRCVVMTRGPRATVVGLDDQVKEFPVPHLPKEKLVDTVGAGDAFVGGFLAAMIEGGDLDSCVDLGIRTSLRVIQKEGCSL